MVHTAPQYKHIIRKTYTHCIWMEFIKGDHEMQLYLYYRKKNMVFIDMEKNWIRNWKFWTKKKLRARTQTNFNESFSEWTENRKTTTWRTEVVQMCVCVIRECARLPTIFVDHIILCNRKEVTISVENSFMKIIKAKKTRKNTTFTHIHLRACQQAMVIKLWQLKSNKFWKKQLKTNTTKNDIEGKKICVQVCVCVFLCG